MDTTTIIGIDLGTTNSEVAVIKDGRAVVLEDNGEAILPSVVGLDSQGQLLVGTAARNQYVLAPERTIRSIKRKMGQEVTVELGGKAFSPQEISAIILRKLKDRAERALGHAVKKVVITVPAFFNDVQRQATREAGELAGLEVVRIINEPTAAVLTYDPHPTELERLLVYDLGGGTFDVSVAQVENGVVEIMASHGDTQLGGDDFDQLLFDFMCDSFKRKHGVDLRQTPGSKARMLRAAEEAKKRLSNEAVTTVEEEFIADKNGRSLNLVMEIGRHEYEELIQPLLFKTLNCLDAALSDAMLQAHQIDKVVLVGGATRTPLIHELLEERLGRPVHSEIEPDLAVAMGAAVQGGLIAGIDVGPILVDITPHTLGISALGDLHGFRSPHAFSPIIPRNTPLPAFRTEIYSTVTDDQEAAEIRVFQGEDNDTRYNTLVGEFTLKAWQKCRPVTRFWSGWIWT
jgi:molecular chaperone DnaK